jgi:hypothetical protein
VKKIMLPGSLHDPGSELGKFSYVEDAVSAIFVAIDVEELNGPVFLVIGDDTVLSI